MSTTNLEINEFLVPIRPRGNQKNCTYPLERNKDYCGLYNSFISKFVVLYQYTQPIQTNTGVTLLCQPFLN